MMGCRKGPWTAEEDKLLTEYVNSHGEGRWTSVAKSSGLNRNGKSCRLRWVNYLRPGLKRSQLTTQEESIIIELHALWGNKWSTISRYLPGRTDNEIKNYWRTYLRHKEKYPDIQEKQKNQILTSQRRQLQVPADLGIILSQPGNNHGMVCKGQGKDQENVFMYPNLELEDQCSSVMFQDGIPQGRHHGRRRDFMG